MNDPRLELLARLDNESDFYALQCDFRTAAMIAKDYAKLRYQLAVEGIPTPPSVSVTRTGIADRFFA